jgi:hypothetical protein
VSVKGGEMLRLPPERLNVSAGSGTPDGDQLAGLYQSALAAPVQVRCTAKLLQDAARNMHAELSRRRQFIKFTDSSKVDLALGDNKR